MAVIKAVNSKASIGRAITYVTKGEKTEEKFISGKDCNPHTAIDEMKATKEQWGKTEGRQYKHYVQSFNPEDKITPEKAHEIGRKFVEETEKFKGHEVLIATHVDKGHIHNHFIVNSVNFENGKKYQEKKQDLEKFKERSNQLSREHGLTIPTKGQEITSFEQKKYKAIEKGFTGKEKSYLLDTAKEVSSSLKTATSREDFIKSMESKGYQVNWKDSRKNITFTTPEGQKVRNTNLEKTFKEDKFSREGMENEIQRNREQGRGKEQSTDRATGERNTPNVDWSAVRNSIESEGNRVSEQPSNDVTRTIQQQVRAVKERTDRAIGQGKSEDREPTAVQRDIESEPKETTRDIAPKSIERDFDLGR